MTGAGKRQLPLLAAPPHGHRNCQVRHPAGKEWPPERGPVTPLESTLNLITGIIAAADVAVVVYVEKVLMTGHKATAGHPAVLPAAPKELIVTGLVFALPLLIILLVTWLRGRAAAAPKPAPRPAGYQFGGPR